VASLDSVTAAAKAAEEARRALVAEALAAVAAGIPKAAVARAAGVSRQTVISWDLAGGRV
jgi:DNA-binding phage protein